MNLDVVFHSSLIKVREESLAFRVAFLSSVSFEPVQRFILQLLDFLLDSCEIILALLLELGISELHTFLTVSEPSKEESENGKREESFLCLLTVLVHGITDKCEVNLALWEKSVFFIMSVWVDHSHEHVYKLLLTVIRHLTEDIVKVLHREGMKKVRHGRLFLLFNPHFLERLEE